jgi:hypothetical protein
MPGQEVCDAEGVAVVHLEKLLLHRSPPVLILLVQFAPAWLSARKRLRLHGLYRVGGVCARRYAVDAVRRGGSDAEEA